MKMSNGKKDKNTIELTFDNEFCVKEAMRLSKRSLTEVINDYISFTSELNEAVKIPIVQTIEKEIKVRINLLDNTGREQQRNLERQISQLRGLRNIIVNYQRIPSQRQNQIVNLKRGYLTCPMDWLLINPENAYDSTCAYVIECLHGAERNIPHYVFFDNEREQNDKFYETVVMATIKKYPDFQTIIDQQVAAEYIKDKPKNYNNISNKDKYFNAPNIGIFKIEDSNDIIIRRSWNFGYVPPENAEVVLPE